MEAQAPENLEELTEKIALLQDRLPKRLRQCAAYILQNTHEIAFSTVAEISEKANVQPSAVMRFCQVVGFGGYTDMQKLVRQTIQPGIPDYSERIQNLREAGDDSPTAILAEFVEAGRQSLEQLSITVNETALEKAVETLAQARLIHIMGLRRAYPVASYLSYAFEKLRIPNVLHGGEGRLTHAEAMREEDVLIAITFASYSSETIELADEAVQRGLPVILISDTPSLLVNGTVVVPLIVSEIDFGAFRSLSATLSLAISLAVATGARRSS
ncbi:RpiR family transcriptional regulator [Loktanella sp. 5RATIMAR09]|uniref:MurR/RpiR family transcriptional regulator n=1 Tax=Loktanella sp. 5RATIMAR09 TaxID=1225655 RepID=UPI0006EBAF59|nr:MurR/RpiR family transcriptional regulator [Loktanella sp. 5RATIMAR09]KQI70730.1 RpiR family transcriptional regulator [Loktanella sp. 5RATIMAR09]